VRVFLVRHAEAAPGDPDELRPLTAAGRDTACAVAERLARERPDAVVSSPLLRARETAQLIAEAVGVDVEADDRLAPGATAGDVEAAVAAKGESVVVVGHQPDCSTIVLGLTGRKVSFAPGTVHLVEL
jgi:phosphohistidine phosphatase